MGPNVLRCQADILGTNRHNYAPQPPTSGMCLLPSISIIGRSCHKYNFHVCCDKSKLVMTKRKRKKKKMFVTTKLLLWEAYFCPDKRRVFCNKNDTCGSSRQWYSSGTLIDTGVHRRKTEPIFFQDWIYIYSPLLLKWSQHIIKTHKYIYVLASEWIVTIWTEWGPECLCRINAQGS